VAQIEPKRLRFNGANQTEKGGAKPPKRLAQIEAVYPVASLVARKTDFITA